MFIKFDFFVTHSDDTINYLSFMCEDIDIIMSTDMSAKILEHPVPIVSLTNSLFLLMRYHQHLKITFVYPSSQVIAYIFYMYALFQEISSPHGMSSKI